jgi:hypothetical protein
MVESQQSVQTLERDLRGIFGGRLQSLVVYGRRGPRARDRDPAHHGHDHEAPIRTMAVVEALSEDDLRACASCTASWHDVGLATPLLLAAHEFDRSLDAFPLEFGAIIADHEVVSGRDPFDTLTVDSADIRRACEVQARSHLLHLREGYLETRGRADALAMLLVQSAHAFAALLTSVARLEGQAGDDLGASARHAERTLGVAPGAIASISALVGVSEISSAQATQLFPPYLDAVERLVRHVDRWE